MGIGMSTRWKRPLRLAGSFIVARTAWGLFGLGSKHGVGQREGNNDFVNPSMMEMDRIYDIQTNSTLLTDLILHSPGPIFPFTNSPDQTPTSLPQTPSSS